MPKTSKNEKPVLTLQAAKNLQLAAMGLLHAPAKKATKKRLLATIRQMAVLQIDTINVVARSPYLVLWSRCGNYPQQWLEELLEEGKLFEYWAHEACFLPIEDYYLYRHTMISPQGLGWKFNQKWLAEQRQQVDNVRNYILQNGATRSIEIGGAKVKKTGWWEWKPEKRSLEVLFTTGELMVAKRHNFQRVYDLRERVHPTWDDAQHLVDPHLCQRQQVLLAVKALGCAKAKWVADYFRIKKIDADNHPAELAKLGLLLTAKVEGWHDDIYIHPDNAALFKQALNGTLRANSTRILSPFDPLVWDRKRALEMFNFDYKLECYTPAPKRKFGYFTLPILHNGELIGRMDAKAHRQEGRFEVKSLHFEEDIKVTKNVMKEVLACIKEFAAWHGTPEVEMPH